MAASSRWQQPVLLLLFKVLKRVAGELLHIDSFGAVKMTLSRQEQKH